MEPSQILQLIPAIGFNGTLVLILLTFGYKFLNKILNHVSHLDAELKNHTQLLQAIHDSLDLLAKK